MARTCVGSSQNRSRRVSPCIAGAILLIMWRRAARPAVAFLNWKRSLGTFHALNNVISMQQDSPVELPQAWPRRPSCQPGVRLFSAGHHDDRHQRRTSVDPKRHALLDVVEKSFESHILSNLPDSSGDVVLVVGVSGGCDSAGLLHALVRILTRTDDGKHFQLSDTTFQLHVVHFNHKQRGNASDGDAVFVQELCEELNLPCHVFEWESTDTIFSQDKARQWRRTTMYTLLQSLISKQQQGVILTAHHLDDSEESLMLKMLRGVHLTNLVGMEPVVTGSNDMPNAMIARPLLNARKADIVDFLQSNNLTWREDESNVSDKYLRNRVRNELIPLLSDMMGGPDVLQKRLENVSQQSRELNKDLTRRAQEYLRDTTDEFVLLSSGESMNLFEKEAFHQWAKTRTGYPLPYDQLQRICLQIEERPYEQRWTLQVGGGWNVVRNGIILTVVRDGVETEGQQLLEQELEWSIVQNGGDELDSIAETLLIQLPADCDQATANCSFVLSDASRSGKWDFTPPWRENPIELRDFLRGQKVPLNRRGCAPVVYVNHGDDKSSLVAVFIEEEDGDCSFNDLTGKWVVNGKFKVEGGARTGRIRVRLPSS